MTPAEVTAIYERSGAMLQGHFELRSGLHSDRYLQSALALRNPADAEALGRGVAELFRGKGITLVVGPALGGIVIAHEVARSLGVPMIYAERDPDTRKMTIRRGFGASPADRVLMVEDVVTTGGGVAEAASVVAATGASIAGYACIMDRTGGAALPWGGPLGSLALMELHTWRPADCPLCAEGSKAVKPGSRPGGVKT